MGEHERVHLNSLSAVHLNSIIAFGVFCPVDLGLLLFPPPIEYDTLFVYGPTSGFYWLCDCVHIGRDIRFERYHSYTKVSCSTERCHTRCDRRSNVLAYCHKCKSWQHKACLGPVKARLSQDVVGNHELDVKFVGVSKPFTLSMPGIRRVPVDHDVRNWRPIGRSIDLDVVAPVRSWERVVDAFLRTVARLRKHEPRSSNNAWAPMPLPQFLKMWKQVVAEPVMDGGICVTMEEATRTISEFHLREQTEVDPICRVCMRCGSTV